MTHDTSATRKDRVEVWGQVFTPDRIVSAMVGMIKNKGRILEPSSGDGAFLSRLDGARGIEIDNTVIRGGNVWRGDFFAYPTRQKFDTIIGNPPYVRHQDIIAATKKLLPMEWFDQRSNLYLFFIAKSMRHLRAGGEIIFITPRDFLKATSAKKLNEALYRDGSITDYIELGDARIFDGHTPNCAIWRWQKGRTSRRMHNSNDLFNCKNGQIWFGPKSDGTLGDHFTVKVGAVSGADRIFKNERNGNVAMVCSETIKNNRTRRMIYNKKDPCLYPHKKELLARKIREFTEANWWQWGRNYFESDMERVYVNCKTRNPRPFFTHKTKAYDGSVMAVFPKNPDTDMDGVADKLNQVDWCKLGFECDGRLLFTQRSLENAPVEIAT